MTAYARDRDVHVLFKGDAFPVSVSQVMRNGGWPGGQFVKWSASSQDEFLVDYSDGLYGGFLLWGSNETSDQFTSLTGNQPLYGFAVLCVGGWILSTSTYERYTYASRQSGPLVPLTYAEGDRLLISLQGWLTKQDEWTESADPRAPNTYFIATVAQAPSAENNNYLTVSTSI